jgi:hypothetical protein
MEVGINVESVRYKMKERSSRLQGIIANSKDEQNI